MTRPRIDPARSARRYQVRDTRGRFGGTYKAAPQMWSLPVGATVQVVTAGKGRRS